MTDWKNIWLFIILISGCSLNNGPQLSNEIEFRCAEYYAVGEYQYSHYYFCSFVPQTINYDYKAGLWKFWNLSGQLIAEGEFDNSEIEINDRGGCPYTIIQHKIISTDWKFWDQNGLPIEASEQLINDLESCQTIRHIKK